MLNLLLTIIYQYNKFKHGEYPLSIIYYHHVFENIQQYHPEDITASVFNQQIKFLKKHFTILSLSKAMQLLEQKKLPPKSLIITFDDGYQDNYTIAAPILEKHHCPATFFIATEGVEQGYLWNDIVEQCIQKTKNLTISAKIIDKEIPISTKSEKVSAFNTLISFLKFQPNLKRSELILQLKSELKVSDFNCTMMNELQIKDLHERGFEIAAHTHSHTILSTESDDNCRKELQINKKILERIIKTPVDFFAYPNGLYGRDFTDMHADIIKELGFKSAFSTNDGGITSKMNIFKLPRFMPYRKQLFLFSLSIAKISGEHV